MLDNFKGLFKKIGKKDDESALPSSGNAARERLHLVLMQDRVNVSADFLDLMKEEIIQVIKKYIDIDESAIDVRLTNRINEDGSNGSPALYANIPIVGIKSEEKKNEQKKVKKSETITSKKTAMVTSENEGSLKDNVKETKNATGNVKTKKLRKRIYQQKRIKMKKKKKL